MDYQETKKGYIVKYIKTKNKIRKIVTYGDNAQEIKKIHTEIAEFINENFMPSKFSKAYIRHKSIYQNALAHMYNDIFISLDIKDFFRNINHQKLINALFLELNKHSNNTINKLECSKIVSNCTVSKKGLPLGLITSPTLSNVYLKEFDNILYGKLKRMKVENIIYTRYADDLVISFKDIESKTKIIDDIIMLVKKLLSKYNLRLNSSKTRIISLDKSNHVKITGINIIKSPSNYRKLTVGRELKNDLFHTAVKYYEDGNTNKYELLKIKGLESFILSIEKNGYEEVYSKNMKLKIKDLGFKSLNELIKGLTSK
ncbi:reverse transcriptase domain-containing protein [Cytobacillus oceanisediminis]|uniref:reverse transcriptase domain-containing protein n=1 Tax=Cytobacillus oceanisediminis TaxID=665099 RepID=UPI0011A515C3|nr:reverse transcriptase domain-containing protein [Cytobacillus oceanisediminis]